MTKHVVVRCWEPRDAPLLKEAVDSSLDELRPWLPWALDEPQTPEQKVPRDVVVFSLFPDTYAGTPSASAELDAFDAAGTRAASVKTTLHEIPVERRSLHGHFSRELEPVIEVFSGDVIRFATLDAGWGVEPPRPDGSERRRFEPLDPELDAGHPLVGPVAVRNARAGMILEVGIESVRVGPYGLTVAGGWSTPLNDRLGVSSGESRVLGWELDADAGTARDREGREVALAPFLGVLGMPPPEPGVHPTGPPRVWGGNLDCKELVAGTKLYLPIPIDGALFSAGDGHARQGDGEVSSTAIECPLERAELSLTLREDFELTTPVARTRDSWIALGLGNSLDEASGNAIEAMLVLMERELGLERRDALALASVVVDLRVTQVVNSIVGVHAVLPDGAIR